MKKKLLSLLLTFGLVLVIPTVASAESVNTIAATAKYVGSDVPAPKFEDVDSKAWYYNAVCYVVQNNLMAGVSDKSFAPDATMTRAMLANILYRLGGSKKTDKSVKITGVNTSAWYYDAVKWAVVNIGYSDKGVFNANDNITRQQMASEFQSYAKYKGRNTNTTADLSVYKDASDVADGARDAMRWAVSQGLIKGTDSSMLLPNGLVTRSQAAAILMHYINATALENRTSDYVSQFIKGNFNDFYKNCSDQFKQSISQDKLLKGWNTIIQVTGAPGGSLGSIYSKQNGSDIVVSSIAATLYNIRITVIYGSDGKPSGIWTSYTPKDPPEPQSTDKWQEIPLNVGEKQLPGMLTIPKGVQKPPVVIMVQGSGSSDMNEAVGTAPNRPFEDIAHGLAKQGVATLRYNKRTYQYPAGGGDTIEYEILDDAAAAVKLLCNDNRVDANRIYLLGHSLGGMMAPKISAANPQLKGFISMAGSLRYLQDIVLDQNTAAIENEASLTNQQKEAMLISVKSEIEKTKTLDDGGTGSILGISTNYWKSLNNIDSMTIAKSLNIPMLILQGSADFQVYPDKDYKLWQSTLEGHNNATFKLYDGLSHQFMPNQIAANGVPDISVYNAPNHVDAQVITDIAVWVNKH